jgi:hypothetical protein
MKSPHNLCILLNLLKIDMNSTSLKAQQIKGSIGMWMIFPLCTLFVIIFAFQSTAQSEITPASLTVIALSLDGCITIPASEEGAIDNQYQLEQVEAHFVDLALLKKRLGFISSNRITFLLNSDESAIIMHLHKDRVQPEQANSVASWNNYVLGKCIQF